ncbi:hypothetical protein O0L34_g19088 [Tuta absoluta]|nr:hypothetical protein O0L34_g19088 [Tuta absoluta]
MRHHSYTCGTYCKTADSQDAGTMGCPQGSVLGPTLWNVLLDDILRLRTPEVVSMVAYADDVTVMIEASSRAAIESKAQRTLSLISEWGARNHLGFLSAKSQIMTIKGKLQRPPIIRMDGALVKNVAKTKLLGVIVDASRSYFPHSRSIGERASNCFGKMARVSAST